MDLYEASGDTDWLQWALDLQGELDTHFWDGDTQSGTQGGGGYFNTRDGDPAILLRMKARPCRRESSRDGFARAVRRACTQSADCAADVHSRRRITTLRSPRRARWLWRTFCGSLALRARARAHLSHNDVSPHSANFDSSRLLVLSLGVRRRGPGRPPADPRPRLRRSLRRAPSGHPAGDARAVRCGGRREPGVLDADCARDRLGKRRAGGPAGRCGRKCAAACAARGGGGRGQRRVSGVLVRRGREGLP